MSGELFEQTCPLFGQDGLDRPLFEDAAVGELDDLGGQLEGFADVVGDGEYRRLFGGEPASEVIEQFVAQGKMQPGERFVEQKQAVAGYGDGGGCGAGYGDTLPLASGELPGHGLGQPGEAEALERLFDDFSRCRRDAVGDVLPHGHVREQRGDLRSEPDAAAIGGQGSPGRAVEQGRRHICRGAMQHDASLIGSHQPCNRSQHGGLAAAGWTEEDRPWLGQAEGGIEGERSLAMLHGEAEMGGGLRQVHLARFRAASR